MTPLQRTALQLPCYCQEDRCVPEHAEWSRVGPMAVMAVLSIDVERAHVPLGGNILPPGMGPIAWHASAVFHNTKALPADVMDCHPETPVIPCGEFTPAMALLAENVLQLLLEGVGDEQEYHLTAAVSKHRWRAATALEREMVAGRSD